MQKLSNLPPALYARLHMMDVLALKFGIPIAKRLFNGNSISNNHACMLVANKIGQKVKKFNLGIFFQKDTTYD